ncbi:type III-B CRISPR-associated protein Cas10/Cmr2 [Thauera aromatica]|uniref:type III-B CRISPR-associated protein Cas10/Cmr2 n=1 Tax=Thauera aromatica TaxID=59405 RepID=UPI001FFD7246|nr:type III-B CRISPR-associated protein Cas10/Cmr2 [Thauera aromatica]MCK2088276.1 type III-B CRISPR-associated protein Cas10/Cmr2 [Thauera aromatica]
MTDTSQNIWLAKLAAWTHDPAEKALVLLRDPAGHEGGTVRALQRALFPNGLPKPLAAHVKRADHWASAADRPQFPRSDKDGRYAAWTQVRFDQQPVLIHPLSGTRFDLKTLDIGAAQIRSLSTDHFQQLIERNADGRPDARRTALAFWRFGPELGADALRALWQLLPADTRIPDHTIWTHLDLSAAFASSFAADADPNPALLSIAFGPVQDFIAQARTTSDLWAGSHLLSRIAWEGLKVLCARLGPDAVIFPQLRGVPLVDLWLRDEMGVNAKRFLDCEWTGQRTDANPLFAAALPNKLVAIVPAGQAQELAEAVTRAVRDFVRGTAQGMLADLLEAAGIANHPELPCHAQLAAQLDGFPEVHWAAVPFAPLVKEGDGAPDTTELAKAGAPFFGEGGFLAGPAWQRLQKPLELEGTRFYRPNAGVLYPALYALLDRVAASAKSVRTAPQRPNGGEQGYRCDLTGEAEWLTHDRAHLAIPKGERKNVDTLWNRAINQRPSLSRKDEHLSALAMLKRMWPRRFVEHELGKCDIDVRRFVVSTHTLAVSTSLERWLEQGAPMGRIGEQLLAKAKAEAIDAAALPRRLMKRLFAGPYSDKQRELARLLPALMEAGSSLKDDPEAENRHERDVRALLDDKPEAYYALILLDGDRMGAWISGGSEAHQLPTRDTFHPQIRERMKAHFTGPEHVAYLDAARAVSPSRHMAISSALNSFALTLAQDIVENRCKGKLIYAGGDDVMALVAVDDLLACLTLLRAAYGGLPIPDALGRTLGLDPEVELRSLRLGGGHALLDGKLLRLMGEHATASAGAVIAHHSAPLGAVLRTLREAEKRAKGKGGRDAFAITLLKRGGGATELTLPWRLDNPEPAARTGQPAPEDKSSGPDLNHSPMGVLAGLTTLFAGDDTSRKAAYVTQGWMPHLPAQMDKTALHELLARNLAHRFKRQGASDAQGNEQGDKLATLALHPRLTDTDPAEVITDVLAVAEFLARESRAFKNRPTLQER